MSVKGKEKASDAATDSDSDIDFFTVKRSTFVKTAVPIRLPSSSPEYESADSDDPDAKRKRKKKRHTKGKTAVPAWMEEVVKPSTAKGRGSSGSRERSTSKSRPDVIEIVDSDEEETEKIKRRKKRLAMELTPPPELPEAEKNRLRQLIDKFLPVDLPETDGTDSPSASTRVSSASAKRPAEDSDFTPDERVTISLRMVADPARRAAGDSEKAIQRYEIKRTMYVNRRDPFSRMLGDLADRIGRDADDLVLEYQGAKLYTGLTPFRLGLQAGTEVDMLGYESAIYEKVLKSREAEKRRKLAELTGESPPDEEEDEGEEADIPEPTRVDPPPEEAKKGTILRLRGEWGEPINIRAIDSITIRALIAHYCTKHGRAGEESKVRMEFDGEELEPNSTVGDLDVEDRVILDVKVVK